ncbi:uncharacterized protein LOC127834947 isoform X2 [Dreissena polymorpha]|uniref:uncharacterized protein LOC127834947 isoform X2 n=1 Tax=Dreissena polymorpha TaxID=45954 RepID=UPI00226473B9|nr:uncharacterized protein LOC127834947 isoform X2 [Dreissena polymorpha]
MCDVCSGAYRSSFRSYRSYSSYSSYRSFRSSGSGSVNTSGGGFIAGMVVMGVVIAVGIIILILCLLKKNGTICSSSTVTTNPSPTLDTINKGFIPTDNHNMGFINPPPTTHLLRCVSTAAILKRKCARAQPSSPADSDCFPVTQTYIVGR